MVAKKKTAEPISYWCDGPLCNTARFPKTIDKESHGLTFVCPKCSSEGFEEDPDTILKYVQHAYQDKAKLGLALFMLASMEHTAKKLEARVPNAKKSPPADT